VQIEVSAGSQALEATWSMW